MYIVACLLLGAELAAQAPRELSKGDVVRVWSSRRRLTEQNGWVDDRIGSMLSLKVASQARLETDELYTTLVLDTADVDSIEVQRGGRWWRANFSGRPFVVADTRIRQPNALERIQPYTRVRLWSRVNGIDGAAGVLVNERPDTLELHFTAGPPAPPRLIPVAEIDRMKVPARGWSTWTGAKRGMAVGAVSGIGYEVANDFCIGNHPDLPTPPNCSPFSGRTVAYGLIGAGTGAVAGMVFAAWTRHRWVKVALPGR
jgi:hypothetical protein